MGLSTSLSTLMLKASLGSPGGAFTPYVALLTSVPGQPAVEPAYTGYARVATSYAAWILDSSGTLLSSPQLTLPAYVSGPAAQIVGWATFDAATGGNIGWSGLTVSFVIDGSDPAPVWAPGAVVLNLASR